MATVYRRIIFRNTNTDVYCCVCTVFHHSSNYIPEHEVSGIYCFCRVSYYYYYSYYVAPTKSGTTYCFSSVSLLLLYFPSFFLSFFQWILSKLVLRTALVDFIHIWHIAGPVPEVEPPTKFLNFGRAKFRLTRKNGRIFKFLRSAWNLVSRVY